MATSTVPTSVIMDAADSALATHEVLDDAAHQEIATEVDEDYAWLTERLDATNRELASLRLEVQTSQQAMLSAFNESREQSRTLIEAQTAMITTLTDNLTALSQSALLRSIPESSETSSQNAQETVTETVTESVPEESAQTLESNAASVRAKKRVRI